MRPSAMHAVATALRHSLQLNSSAHVTPCKLLQTAESFETAENTTHNAGTVSLLQFLKALILRSFSKGGSRKWYWRWSSHLTRNIFWMVLRLASFTQRWLLAPLLVVSRLCGQWLLQCLAILKLIGTAGYTAWP